VTTSPLAPNESQLLLDHGFRHAFFTRLGGVSEGPYRSLNFSYAVGDLPTCVDENFRRAAAYLETAPNRLCFLSQVHGNTCVEATPFAPETRDDLGATSVTTILPAPQFELIEGDALCSSDPTLACAVRTADCLPILLADIRTGRVAAVHAGWRGLVNGVITSAVAKLASNPTDIIAAIGPHIETGAFEVSDDVAYQLRSVSYGTDPVRTDGYARPHVDLRVVAECQLRALGVQPNHIQQVLGCTYAEPALYFSFRRDGQVSGRLLSAICPRS
jgi:polyphenol oxidase